MIYESWNESRESNRPKIPIFLDSLYNCHLYFYLLLYISKEINQIYVIKKQRRTTVYITYVRIFYLCFIFTIVRQTFTVNKCLKSTLP